MPTQKIGRSGGRSEEPPVYQRDTPTEKMDARQPPQSYPSPRAEAPAPAAKTEILSREPPTFAWLIVVTGPQTSQIHRLSADVTDIGRDASNTVPLDDASVSRQHVKIRAEEDEDGNTHFYLYDQASTTGGFVNGERVYRHELTDGDRLKLGRTELVFKRPEKLLMEEVNDG